MSQSHGTSLWREPVGSGGVPVTLPAFFVASGADYVIAVSGTEAAQLVDGGSGDVLFSTNLTLPRVRAMVRLSGDVILY